MLRFVYRQLRYDPLRTILTVTAIAAVVAVILILEGFNEGLLAQLRNAVMNRQADLIVTQAGVSNMTATRSILPQVARRQVETVDGIAIAHPLTGIPVIYEQDDQRTPIFMLVYDEGGGPQKLIAGSSALAAREIVVDRSLAKKYALRVGDALIISDFEFRIAGIATDAAAFFTPFAFALYDDLIDFYLESDVAADISTFPLVSFLLVELEFGADRSAVADRIEASVPSADVLEPEILAEKDAALGRVIFGPILRLLISVAYGIGILVTGVIMFAAVHARRKDFGVLKALGFSHAFLSTTVVVEALILTVVAIPLGVGLAAAVSGLLGSLMPLYLILPTEPTPTLRTTVACLAFAVVGALVPIRLIRGVDPSLVFRG